MSRRLGPDAFDRYVALGPDRSYTEIARHFGVSKRSVTRAAAREQWQERLRAAEDKARAESEKKAVETLEAMRDRHLRMLKAVQGRAVQALQSMPLETASAAVKALLASLAQERLLRDDGAAAGADDVEAIVRREYALFLKKPGAKDDWDD
jgi:transposase-like protein